MTVFGDNFALEGLRLPGLRERFSAFALRLARRSPAFFAVCCCSSRDFYVGREMPERVPLGPLGCMKCPKFARGCWGPRVEERG
ncbi:hypothetical protein [Cloacibacillus sp. An23]|uniref:hypothetical protein n=1 Tax=Cloacibacillus sp. An23 TaxID=1965591 RepID=UPI000B3871B8|nr:hypothetical protein [Cloacibacillus sp. An23]OUO94717.1 hypothetical protein B5F39_02285 [Cloacibacillus sp. An23]